VLLGTHQAPGKPIKRFSAEGEINFRAAKIGNAFRIYDIDHKDKITKLDLSFTNLATLDYSSDSFLTEGRLFLNGLGYSALGERFPADSKRRIAWLRRQSKKHFSVQPYEQLAKILKLSGDETGSTRVLIAKQDDLRRHGGLGPFRTIWNLLLDFAIGHGYKPHRVLWGMLLFVFFGARIFEWGYYNKLMTPTTSPPIVQRVEQDYPKFNKLIYSLDTFLPIIDFKQKSYWLPNAKKETPPGKTRWGSVIRNYLWIHTVFGWVLTTLWVVPNEARTKDELLVPI
jgi:hypothetical protein